MRNGHFAFDAPSLLAAPLALILPHLRTCPRAELMRIYRLGVVCRCDWFDGLGFGLRAANCVDGVPVRGFVACPHLPGDVLEAQACSVILARLWPREYADPPEDRSPSPVASYNDCLALRIDRARRRRRLWHPLDAQQSHVDGSGLAVGLAVSRSRNGDIVEEGAVDVRSLHGDDYDYPNAARMSGKVACTVHYEAGRSAIDENPSLENQKL